MLPRSRAKATLAPIKNSRAARYNPRGLRLRVRLRRLFFPVSSIMRSRSYAMEPRPRIAASVRPIFVSKGRLVQLVPMGAPLRHESVHQTSEPVVVGALDKVNHLVHEDIIEA